MLLGSGWVSFLVILLLPLRLGEVSRPVLLARPRLAGLGLPEAISAVATERVVDGLLVVGLLFAGLSIADPVSATAIDVRAFGRGMAALFVVALLALVLIARAPRGVTRLLAPLVRGLGPTRAAAALGFAERLSAALRPLGQRRQGIPFVALSLVYWAITVVQCWLLLVAFGLPLGLAEAATLIAAIGLSIQLPGGPAQAGSFQVGAAVGLGLYLDAAALAGPGSQVTATLYFVGIVGALVMAAPGAYLLARPSEARDPPPPAKGPVGERD